VTIEELLGMSADELDKLTPEQRANYFDPFLNITRPDRAQLIAPVKKSANKAAAKGDPVGRAIAEQFLMKQFGISPDQL